MDVKFAIGEVVMKKICFSLLLILVLFASCNNKKEEVIVFDNTYPLALSPDVSWAVVKEPYAAYKMEPAWSAEAKGHCRKGEILQVIGKSIDSENSAWYFFEDGWLPENCLLIYNNRYKAKTAAEQFKE